MKTKFKYYSTLVFLIVIKTSVNQAQNYFAIKSIQASVSGTSTFHDWRSIITKTECTCYLQKDELSLKTISDVQVKILVAGIKSTEGKIMDEKTYEAFKYKVNPYITFTANNIQVDTSKPVINIAGNLTMAGVSRPITLGAEIGMVPNGDVEVSIVKKLKMTEFNMKPPTAVLGTIVVGDEVTLSFNLILTSKSNSINNSN
jgi:hypothetical protein